MPRAQSLHRWKVASSVTSSGRNSSRSVFVRLTASDGLSGLGESAPSVRYGETPEESEAFLRRIDPARLHEDDGAQTLSYLETLGPGAPSAKGAVDMALLDLAAKRAGVPLSDHLGLGFREGVHVTSFSIGLDDPEVTRWKAAEVAAYPILRLKVGGPRDRENLAAVREAAHLQRGCASMPMKHGRPRRMPCGISIGWPRTLASRLIERPQCPPGRRRRGARSLSVRAPPLKMRWRRRSPASPHAGTYPAYGPWLRLRVDVEGGRGRSPRARSPCAPRPSTRGRYCRAILGCMIESSVARRRRGSSRPSSPAAST